MLGLFLASYPISMMFSKTGHYLLSGFVLIIAALGLYVNFYLKEKKLLDFRGLLSLAWIGGEGLAALKLSKLGSDWHILTWIAFLLFYLCFLFGYERLAHKKTETKERPTVEVSPNRLVSCAVVLAVLSAASFLTEAAVLGFVPLFSREPHAYSYFHLTGIHYFTVSSILIVPLSVIWFYLVEKPEKKKLLLWGALDILAFAIPILCVSRFMVIMGAGMAVLSYLLLDKKIKLRYLVLTVAGLGAAYLFLSVARNHDVTYLNGIFEMKNPDLPIFISQPYMYVAMNYENFNYLVVNLIEHSFGMRQIYPFIALTGAKFLIPGLGAEFPLYLRKEELSTLTLIYDAYYDFHLLGVVGFGLLFGIVCQKTADGLKKKVNPVAALFYVQFAMYALLSFFTSWFSVATTWFWLFLTAVFYVVMSGRKPEIKKQTIVRICAALAGILLCTGLVRAHVFAGKPAKGEFSFGLQFYTDRRTGKGARVQTDWWKDEENGKYFLFLPSGVNLELAEVQLTGAERIVLDGETVWNDGTVYTWAGMHDISVPSTGKLYQVEFIQSQGHGSVFLDTEKSVLSVLDGDGVPEYTGNMTYQADEQYEKASYQISLEKEASLYGIGTSKNWQLLGNADDKTLLRRYLSFDIAYQMGAYHLPQSAFVDLYLNREYRGTYQLLMPVTEEMMHPEDVDGRARQYLMEELFHKMGTWYERTDETASYYADSAVRERVKELYRDNLCIIVNEEITGRIDKLAQRIVTTAMMDGYRWRKWPESGNVQEMCQAFLSDIGQLNLALFERLPAIGETLGIQ